MNRFCRYSQRALAALAALFLSAAPARTETGAENTAEGPRYRVIVQAGEERAAEMLRVLEAAYPLFQKHFGAKPKLKKGEKLEVRHYKSKADWVVGVRSSGAPPPGSAGGIYLPATKVAYFHDQPTRYYTRVLMLHEAAHQFHYLARTKNKEPTAKWYTEGLAEYLSWHHWDGSTLELGVRPLLSLENRAGAAITTVGTVDFEAFVAGDTKLDRGVAWALVRYLATGNKGKPHKKFKAFARKMDGGNKPGSLFRKLFGTPKQVKPDFEKWLAAEQSPWVYGFNEWEPLTATSLRGFAKKQYTVAYLREPAKNLTATLIAPKKQSWNAGVLVHWSSPDDYTVALLNYGGFMHVVRRMEGRWQTMEKGPIPGLENQPKYTFQVFRRGGEVSLLVNNQGLGPWELPGSTLGLALMSSDVRFVDLNWK